MLYTGKSIYRWMIWGYPYSILFSRYSRKPPYIAHLYIKLQMATDTATTYFDAFSCCIFHRAWHMISFSLPFSSQHQDVHDPLGGDLRLRLLFDSTDTNVGDLLGSAIALEIWRAKRDRGWNITKKRTRTAEED